MDKTVVVAVTLWREHTLYHKRYQVTRKFKAHDEKDEYAVGDTVTIAETRPLSKEKRWKVMGKATGDPEQLRHGAGKRQATAERKETS